MKKFASLLLAFAMTVGMLTGCGGDSGTSSTGEAPAQEVTVAISSTFATLDGTDFHHPWHMSMAIRVPASTAPTRMVSCSMIWAKAWKRVRTV